MLKASQIFFIFITVFHYISAGKISVDVPVNLIIKLMKTGPTRTHNSMMVYLDPRKQDPVNHFTTNDKGQANDEETTDENDDYDDLLLTSNHGLIDDYYYGPNLEKTAKHHAKFLLYNFLRTTPDQEQDPTLEETKQVLRQALRSRCNKVYVCVLACTVKKPSCPKKCQQDYDKQDLCEPPKPKQCKKAKCGRTMPPKWLL